MRYVRFAREVARAHLADNVRRLKLRNDKSIKPSEMGVGDLVWCGCTVRSEYRSTNDKEVFRSLKRTTQNSENAITRSNIARPYTTTTNNQSAISTCQLSKAMA